MLIGWGQEASCSRSVSDNTAEFRSGKCAGRAFSSCFGISRSGYLSGLADYLILWAADI